VTGVAREKLSPRYVERLGLTSWFSVPSTGALFARYHELGNRAFPSLRLVLFAGEALHESVAETWHRVAPNARLLNLYGPTETTIAVTAYEVPRVAPGTTDASRTGVVPIGQPFPGHRARIVNARGHEAARGEAGELWISGPQVAVGYLGDRSQTDERFLVDADGTRWYRTGDSCALGADELLHYRGRIDNEVKIAGYRVAIEEVEAALRSAVPSREAAAVALQPERGPLQLYGVVVSDREADGQLALNRCRETLPRYMVPRRVFCTAALPTTERGKLDRPALKIAVRELVTMTRSVEVDPDVEQ
jgi:acyl-coenzyme A synthetase/AMP-(fatty) acid ligase